MKASKDGPKLNLRLLQGEQKDEQIPQEQDAAEGVNLQSGQVQQEPTSDTSAAGAAHDPAQPVGDAPPILEAVPDQTQDFAFDPDALSQGRKQAEVTAFPLDPGIPSPEREATPTPDFLNPQVKSESSNPLSEQPSEQEDSQAASPASEPVMMPDAAAAAQAQQTQRRRDLTAPRRQRPEAKTAEAKTAEAKTAEAPKKDQAKERTAKEAKAPAGGQSVNNGNRNTKRQKTKAPTGLPAIGKVGTKNRKNKAAKPLSEQVPPAVVLTTKEPEPQPEPEPKVDDKPPVSGAVRAMKLFFGFFKSLLLLAVIVGPMVLAGYYYFFVAADRYEVRTLFLIRTAGSEVPAMTTILGQPQAFGRAADESFSVVDYITSYEGMLRLNNEVDLREAYSKPKDDPFYYLPADSNYLELHDYYLRMVDTYYDQITGLVTIDVRAYTADDAYNIAAALLTESERLINEFNKRAQADLLQLARTEVTQAFEELERIERQLTAFRQDNNIIDPMEVITRVNGIIAGLEGEVAKTEAELLQLSKVTGNRGGVMRLELEARIEALRVQVERERERLIGQQESMGSLIPEFELLNLRKVLAGEAYSAALASMQSSIAQAQRQQLYVVPVVAPTKLDQAQLPDRWENLFFVFLVVMLVATVGRLLYLGVRDHIL